MARPVAVEPGHAPFDALAKALKTAILDDGIMHLVHAAVAEPDIPAAIAARNIVGLPGPKCGFMDSAVGLDLQRGIPQGALFLLELVGDGSHGLLPLGRPSFLTPLEQP